MENVRRTGLADEIIIEEEEGQKITDIQKYEVDIFTIGSDWVDKFDYLSEYCEVVYLERIKGGILDRAQTETRPYCAHRNGRLRQNCHPLS